MDNRPLIELENIEEAVANQLEELGIITADDLRRVGSAGAYNMIKTLHPDETLPLEIYLYSLEGAIQERHWDDISDAEKEELRHLAGI